MVNDDVWSRTELGHKQNWVTQRNEVWNDFSGFLMPEALRVANRFMAPIARQMKKTSHGKPV